MLSCIFKYKDNQWLQITTKMKISCSRWWQLKYFFMFTPFFLGILIQIDDCAYFSNGLVQPPTFAWKKRSKLSVSVAAVGFLCCFTTVAFVVPRGSGVGKMTSQVPFFVDANVSHGKVGSHPPSALDIHQLWYHFGAIKMGPICGGIKQSKFMVIFRDFPDNNALFGLVIFMTRVQNRLFGFWNMQFWGDFETPIPKKVT